MDKMDKDIVNDLSYNVIGAAIEVHRFLGPGLLESAYEECMSKELSIRGIPFKKQVPLPINYKGTKLNTGYRLDFLIDDLIIVELKCITTFEPIHKAQLLALDQAPLA